MDPFLPPEAQAWLQDILIWIGYGTLVGLLAKAIMPGRDPGGAVVTLAMGITGVIIGCGVYSLWGSGPRLTPVSSIGLACGTAGALVILVFYRLLGGWWADRTEPARPGRWDLRGSRRFRRLGRRRGETAHMWDE